MTMKDYAIWGRDLIPDNALEQMDAVASLPIYGQGALFPDSHLGYGLPIGAAVLAEHIIPYGVGVDIGCQMYVTVFDADASEGLQMYPFLSQALKECAYFGPGSVNDQNHHHPVMDRHEWETVAPYKDDSSLFDTARRQLGTSGGGNHFVEFGVLDGKLTLVSHSGSRGVGFKTCNYYTDLAMAAQPGFKHLAWLDGDTEVEYLLAHNLMRDYARANHEIIHFSLADRMFQAGVDTDVLYEYNTPHNEVVKRDDGYLHRKGATGIGAGPAYIPGTMQDPGFVVWQCNDAKGNLDSCSHGAGRTLSRRQAKKQHPEAMPEALDNVTLIGGDKDELPHAYKDIRAVIDAQSDIIHPAAEFAPRIVRMAEGRRNRRDEKKQAAARDLTNPKEDA